MSSDGGFRFILDGISSGQLSKSLFEAPKQFAISHIVSKLGHDIGMDKNVVTSSIAALDPRFKKSVIRTLERKYGFSYPNAAWMPTTQEISGYDFTHVNIPGNSLKVGKTTEFEVNIPYNQNYNFISSQFLKLVIKPPTAASVPVLDDGQVVKSWYGPKPGIRILEHIEAKSDISSFDEYRYYDVLKYENDSLPSNIFRLWNDLIGQDLGSDAVLYNPANEANEVHRVKVGYQTAKSTQKNLELYIPLLFAHNRNLNDKLNMAIFNKNTINFKGVLAPSEQIARMAVFNTQTVTESPTLLTINALQVERCELYNLATAVDDLMFAINLGLYYNRLYDYTKHFIEPVKVESGDVKLRNGGELLQMAIFARPKSYSADFNKWIEFTPVQSRCIYVPVVIDDAANLPNGKRIAIVGAKLYSQIKPFANINLMYDGSHIMSDGSKDGSGDPNLWTKIDPFSKSMRYLDYEVRRDGIVYFNFNPHVNTKKVGCIYNMNKLQKSYLKYKFSSDVPSVVNGNLTEDFEIFVFYQSINCHVMSGDSIVKKNIN
jgi:hypothetical protein